MTPAFQTIPSLNGIRAASVLLVMLSHAGFGEIVPGGFGVTVFFFLSGYLITTLLVNEFGHTATIDVRNFYIRRFFRLFPPLVVTLAIAYSLVASGFLPGGITLYGVLSQLFYFANYYAMNADIGKVMPGGTVILWSLAIEEHFYIVYPLVMLGLLSRGVSVRRIGQLFVVICAVVLLWRLYLASQPGFLSARTYFGTDTRIDSILFGTLLALWHNPMARIAEKERMSVAQWAIVTAALGLLFATFLFRSEFFRQTTRYTLQGIALYPLFYFAVRYHDNFVFRHLNWQWISKIGIWSYAIYLIHYVAIIFVETHWSGAAGHPVMVFLVAAVISICYAMFIDKWIDPYFRWRARPRPAGGRGKDASSVAAQTGH